MRLELAPGGATPGELERARVDVSRALDDARSFLARRDAPRAAHAFDAVARARFFFSRIESQAAFELALDALSLAAHAVTTGDDTHDPTRLAGAELGSSAATVVASVIRDAEARRDGYARAAATRGVDAFLRGVLRARELAKLSSSAVTSSVLALMAIGSEESSRAAASAAAAATLGEFAFETPAAAAQYAYAYAYGVIENDGFDAACALLEAWEVMDVGDEYAVSRKSLFGGGALRRVMENVFVSGAVPRATMVNLAKRCETDSRIGNVYVLGALFRSSAALKDLELKTMCAQTMVSTASVLEKWLATSTRDVTLEARALACISSFSACVDIDESNGPLRSLKTLLARATLKVFSHTHGSLLHSLAERKTPQETSHILHDLTTSPIYMNAHFIAEAVSRDDGVDPSAAFPMLAEFAKHSYETARELNSRDYATWVNALDIAIIRAARAHVYEFVLVVLKNTLRGRLDSHVTEALHVLGHMEFARTTSVEYAQVLGAIANVLISLPPAGDAPIALAFLENLPILADSWASDNVLGARIHLSLRLLPFILSKVSHARVMRAVCPYIRQCCDHDSKTVVKAAHVVYVGIFHVCPELNDEVFPEYMRMALERYPASTPLEPFIAAVGLVTKFGEAGSEIALFIAQKLIQKVRIMDAATTEAPPASDPPVEALRRLLFQLVTLVDFPLIPAIQEMLQDAVLSTVDPGARENQYQTLAYTVMRCPDYARKPMCVDWIMAMSSKL